MAKVKKAGAALPPGSRFVRLELTPEQHARLRVVAAEAGLSMAAYARKVVVGAIGPEPAKSTPRKTGHG